MLKIEPIPLPEVRVAWNWIRNGLLAVIGICRERWSPEDAWTEIQAGNAFVWRIETAHDAIGFLLLKRVMDPDGPVLFIWAAWCEPGSLLRHKAELFERLKELSHRMGAKRIRYESSRDEWLAVDYFTPVRRVFEYEV